MSKITKMDFDDENLQIITNINLSIKNIRALHFAIICETKFALYHTPYWNTQAIQVVTLI